jgi:hypothetical protein
MYDILPILDKLKTEEPFLFNKVEQAIQWPTADVGRGRLTAAFVAVRMKDGGHTAFHSYINVCQEHHHLPEDQKQAIEQFLSPSPPSKTTSSDDPTGEWTVRVSKWLWMYKFDARGSVTWRDPYNGMTGRGKWTMKASTMRIDWVGSTTVDEWNLPLDLKAQSGKVRMKGETHTLSATKA